MMQGQLLGINLADVQGSECELADETYETQLELNEEFCQTWCTTYCEVGGDCYNNGWSPYVGTPILADLDDNGFELVGRAQQVMFDMNGDGTLDTTTWTRAGERDAFLAMDVNNNGTIDSGRELFGDTTLLRNGEKVSNGFEALADYDTPAAGGNGDGNIDEADAVYSRLRMWIDFNHDARSQTSELMSLPDAGVVSISTHYTVSRRRDQHGNWFRFKAKADVRNRKGRIKPAKLYDVMFLH